MKNLLIITYHFPPVGGGVGVFRITKFVKYLREFNWEPVIITTDYKYFPFLDNGFLADLPKDLKIFRKGIISLGSWISF